MKAYLAGAIRNEDDYRWREDFAKKYEKRLTCIVPSDIGVDDFTKLRRFTPSALMTYKTDLALIDLSDLVVMNLNSLGEGYPSIGTLVELGYAVGRDVPVLVVCNNKKKRHPFISFATVGAFDTFEELDGYLGKYLDVVEGKCPHFAHQ